MRTTNLRKVGGSVMLAVPPALLDTLDLRPGSEVGLSVEGGRLIVDPQPRRKYSLEDLLAQCDRRAARPKKDRAWLDSAKAGSELLG